MCVEVLECASFFQSESTVCDCLFLYFPELAKEVVSVTTDVKWVETNGVSVGAPVFPAKTHPNAVSRAVGLLSGPDRRPLRSTSTKIPTPSSMSTVPGLWYSGSARTRPSKCFHLSGAVLET